MVMVMEQQNQINNQFLPVHTKLQERYEILKVNGEGNFGITYIGWDCLLESKVAIKEFFPVSRVRRDVSKGEMAVYVFQEKEYEQILEKYLEEARKLSKLNQIDGIVSIRDFFYANHTAYIVMDYIEGTSIRDYIQENGTVSEHEIKQMLKPIFSSLSKIHEQGIIHRDISADNIMITDDNRVILVDFGSARQINLDEDKSMTVMIKRGYSAPELYRSHGEQGPYTDVYAVCATIYYMLTGKSPDEAIDRILEDETESLVKTKGVRASMEFRRNVMKGISLKAKERFDTMEELENALYTDKKRGRVLAGLAVIVILAGLPVTFLFNSQKEKVVSAPKEKTETVKKSSEPTPQMYEMISGIGKTKQEILETLPGLKEKAVTVTWKSSYDENSKKGFVIAQSIPADTPYSKEKTVHVTFTLSKGVKKVSVPSVVGMNYKEAEKKIKSKGFTYKIVWQKKQNGKAYVVLAQSVRAGTKKRKKTCIKLTVCKSITQEPTTKPTTPTKKPKKYDGVITY